MKTRHEILRDLYEEIAAHPEENPEAAEVARVRLQEDDDSTAIVERLREEGRI